MYDICVNLKGEWKIKDVIGYIFKSKTWLQFQSSWKF